MARLFFDTHISKVLHTLHEEFVIQERMRFHGSKGGPYLSVGMNFSRAEGTEITQVPTRIRVLVAPHDPRTKQSLGEEKLAAILNVRPLSDTRTVLDTYCMEEVFEPYLNGLLSTLCNVFTGMVEGDIPKEPEQPTAEAPATKPAKGMKAGTAERVTEFHRLVKSGMSHRQAKQQSHCDPATYYQWCKEVTGEKPIEPYR